MILLLSCNSSIKGTKILDSISYPWLLRLAIFFALRNLQQNIIFYFNSWLSIQRQWRLLREYPLLFVITACTVVQAVVKATSQSNGKGQILTPTGLRNP